MWNENIVVYPTKVLILGRNIVLVIKMEARQQMEKGVEIFDEKFENFYSKVESMATKKHDYI